MMIGSVSVPMKVAGNQRKASVNNTTATFKGTKSSGPRIKEITGWALSRLHLRCPFYRIGFQFLFCIITVNPLFSLSSKGQKKSTDS